MKNFFSVGLLLLAASTFAQQTNQIDDTGNVGINNTNPTKQLQINGSLNGGTYTGIFNEYLNYVNNAIFESFDNNDGGRFVFRSSKTAGSTDVMVIDRFGKVGIGTTSPKEKLQIGNGITFHDGGNKVLGFAYGPSLEQDTDKYAAEIRFDPNSGNLRLGTSNSKAVTPTTRLTINNIGNVGIGTTTPDSRLTVVTTAADEELIARFMSTSVSNLTRGVRINSKNTSGAYRYFDIAIDAENDKVGFGLGTTTGNLPIAKTNLNTAQLVIDRNGGKVGIGTATPSSKLNVRSTIAPVDTYPPSERNDYYKVKDYDLLYLQQDGSNKMGPSIFMKGFNNGNSFSGRISLLESGGANADIAFLTSTANGYNQNEVMRVTSKSTVGIGTKDTKGFKLGVKGKIAAEEVKVATYTNWADFVFKKEYNLPTLKEVENHIKEKGHLKDIPSAKEVEKNGFYLGQMDAKLLQKIEELTLYTIEQEKQIQELKKQTKEIKKLKEEAETSKQQVKEIEKLKEEVKELGKLKELINQLLKKNTK